MLISVIEVWVVSPEAIKSIDGLMKMRHHYQPRLEIDRSCYLWVYVVIDKNKQCLTLIHFLVMISLN